MDHNVGNCSALAPQLGRMIVNFFPAHQLGPECVEAVLVDKEFIQVMADVLLGCVSEKFQHSFIGPYDSLVRSCALHAFQRIFEQIGQFRFPALERSLGFPSLRGRDVESLRPLLQMTDVAQALFLCGERHVALAGNHVGMFRADFKE